MATRSWRRSILAFTRCDTGFASWCINRKVDGGLELPAKAVQERLGHSSITVTFDTYGHLFPIADEAEALAAAETALMLRAT